MHLTHNKNKGVVLLYAVLLVSIVLTISLSLMNITYKQIILTAVSKDSQVAHFVALSALDCAAFTNWKFRDQLSGDDISGNPFGVFSPDHTVLSPGTSLNFVCGSASGLISVTEVITAPDGPISPLGINATWIISSYKLSGPGLGGSCAKITVVKVQSGNFSDEWPGSGGDDDGEIFYTALGYNTTCDLSNPRLIERRVRM